MDAHDEMIAAQREDGPEFSDGHDCEGFPGGCARFGCPGAVSQHLCTALAKMDVVVSGKQNERDLETDWESRAMFVARLENMQANGEKWLTIVAVLALMNDCDMLAQRAKVR